MSGLGRRPKSGRRSSTTLKLRRAPIAKGAKRCGTRLERTMDIQSSAALTRDDKSGGVGDEAEVKAR